VAQLEIGPRTDGISNAKKRKKKRYVSGMNPSPEVSRGRVFQRYEFEQKQQETTD
jgi:hypothetical protein